VCNPYHETFTDKRLFVFLDIFGEYYFAPDYTDFDYFLLFLIPGEKTIEILSPFSWPDISGSVDEIVWVAGMTNSEMTELFGAFDLFEFGWSE